MRLIDSFEIVFSTFSHNKMRSFLTAFAVSVGIGSIILLVSLGFGLQKLTIERISSSQALSTLTLTSANTEILKIDEATIRRVRDVEAVESIGKNYSFSGRLLHEDSQTDIALNLVDENYLKLEDLIFDAGEVFGQDDKQPLIISSSAAKALGFEKNAGAIGKKVSCLVYYSNEDLDSVEEVVLEIIGVTRDDESSLAYAPIDLFKIPAQSTASSLKARVVNTEYLATSRKSFEQLGLSVYSVAETIGQMNRVFKTIQYILGGFGIIALFVASIGMFNTLTISLLERTREIGIMRVLGATASDIRKIFLIEAVSLSVAGGLLGFICSYLIAAILNAIIGNLSSNLGSEATRPFFMPSAFIFIILGVSVLIGLLTGIYPARRASKINPLDALRYE